MSNREGDGQLRGACALGWDHSHTVARHDRAHATAGTPAKPATPSLARCVVGATRRRACRAPLTCVPHRAQVALHHVSVVIYAHLGWQGLAVRVELTTHPQPACIMAPAQHPCMGASDPCLNPNATRLKAHHDGVRPKPREGRDLLRRHLEATVALIGSRVATVRSGQGAAWVYQWKPG